MATKPPKKTAKRHEIRVVGIPEGLFRKIQANSKTKRITQGNELINFLETNNYK